MHFCGSLYAVSINYCGQAVRIIDGDIRSWSKRGHAVAQLVEALRYELEGRGFDSRWCHWPWGRISLKQKWVPGGRCAGLTKLPHYVPIVFKSGSLSLLKPSGPFQACTGIALPLPLRMNFTPEAVSLFENYEKWLFPSPYLPRYSWNNSAPTGGIVAKFDMPVFFKKIWPESSCFIKIWQE